jgi:hypothetical protein
MRNIIFAHQYCFTEVTRSDLGFVMAINRAGII